jgi:predicted transcriptional regulator
MPTRKISDDKLFQLIKDGNSPAEIARKMGVTKSAISKRLKSLNMAITKDVTLRKVDKIIRKEINAIDQLQKINAHANELLERAMRVIRGDEESQDDMQRDPREVALKAMQEIRGQLKLQLEIFQVLRHEGSGGVPAGSAGGNP